MRTVGKGVRQVRNASRDFKDAIGLDELMREGDPFRAPPIRPPKARPGPVQDKAPSPSPSVGPVKTSSVTGAASAAPPILATDATDATDAADAPGPVAEEPESEADAPPEAKHS
ncbi:MAG: hypothetical protein JRH14_00520 [Deltaproteobacteria bacterium]|nr:hypothetical protein [Deltaproteobacteria bacterium]